MKNEILSKFSTDDLNEILLSAAVTGNIDAIKAALDEGTNIDIQLRTSFGMTALMHAVNASQMEAMKYLILKGADVNARDSFVGNTALHLAVDQNNYEATKVLLDSGADPNLENQQSKNVLQWAKSLTNNDTRDEIIALIEGYCVKTNIMKKEPSTEHESNMSVKNEELHNSATEKSLFCKLCKGPLLSKNELLEMCKNVGFEVDFKNELAKPPGTRIGVYQDLDQSLEGIEKRNWRQQAYQNLYSQMEFFQGFVCRNCGTVYCMKCLSKKATIHKNGGKACPKCGGSFAVLVEVTHANIDISDLVKKTIGEKEALSPNHENESLETESVAHSEGIQCDMCTAIIREGEGFLFYSPYVPNPSIGPVGNLFLCDACTSVIINDSTWTYGIVENDPEFGLNPITYRGISEGIVQLCKAHDFTPDQAKDKGRELASTYWQNREKGQKESLAFWKSKPSVEDKGSKCFIATACYGSYDDPNVLTLRRFRDEKLMPLVAGRILLKLYYFCSPFAAFIIRKNSQFRHLVKFFFVRPIVDYISKSK